MLPFMELLYEGVCPDCGSATWWMGPEGGMTNMYRSPCGLWASVSPFGTVFVDRDHNRWCNLYKVAPLGGDYNMTVVIQGVRLGIGDLVVWGNPPRDMVCEIIGIAKHKIEIADANETPYLVNYTEIRPYADAAHKEKIMLTKEETDEFASPSWTIYWREGRQDDFKERLIAHIREQDAELASLREHCKTQKALASHPAPKEKSES